MDYALKHVIYGLFFQQSRANNSKVSGLIRPEFEPVWDLMPVLVTCKFGKDHIKNEHTSVETSFSHYRNFVSAQGRITLKWIIQSRWNLNSSEMWRLSWIPESLVKIRPKLTEERWWVDKKAMIRNRYNRIPHPALNTKREWDTYK